MADIILADVQLLNSTNSNTNVLIEQDGEVNRVNISKIQSSSSSSGGGVGWAGTGTNAEIFNDSSNIASSWYAHAEGEKTTANASHAHAEGSYTVASGENSHAEGGRNFGSGFVNSYDFFDPVNSTSYTVTGTTAFGDCAHAEGRVTYARGVGSHSEGNVTFAYGGCSHAEGDGTRAFGDCSHTEGSGSYTSDGVSGHAEGGDCWAYGNYAHAGGYATQARGNQYAIGHYNSYNKSSANVTLTEGVTSGSTSNSPAFIIGNGSSNTSKGNAFRIDYDGKASALKTFSSTGADYAEYFEWLDGNEESEDRRGYFVTLDGDKIKKASENDYLLGIVSGLPAVLGNNDEQWMGRYLFDEFGAFITEEFEYQEKVYEDGLSKEITKIGTRYKVNPEYDPEREYIPRDCRPEWNAVGMLGVLSVRDDGTCQINGYCKPNADGIATASDVPGYRVIKRVSDNVVKVIFR